MHRLHPDAPDVQKRTEPALTNRESADYQRLLILREDLARRANEIDDTPDTSRKRALIREMIKFGRARRL